MFLDENTFKTVITSTPLISIDLVVKNSDSQYLLGYRNNRPAKGYWFVPGGRILKDETMDQAFIRLCKIELGLDLIRSEAKFLGPFEHFYGDYVFGDNVSTHYVVLGYEIEVNLDLHRLPKEQHGDYKWFSKQEFLNNDTVHKHSKWYLQEDT